MLAEALIALAAAARRVEWSICRLMDLWIGPETSIGRPMDVWGGPEPARRSPCRPTGASTPESGLLHPQAHPADRRAPCADRPPSVAADAHRRFVLRASSVTRGEGSEGSATPPPRRRPSAGRRRRATRRGRPPPAPPRGPSRC